MLTQPYLFFDGRCEEALEFYREALGAEVIMLMRFKESPDPVPSDMVAPGSDDKIMHSAFRIGETVVMASDGGCKGQAEFKGFSLSVTVDEPVDADRLFTALAEGGEIQMPIGKTFWSPRFGMVADKFGIGWMIGVTTEDQG